MQFPFKMPFQNLSIFCAAKNHQHISISAYQHINFLAVAIILSFTTNFSVAQDFPEARNYDYVYKDYIKTVRLHPFDSEKDYPVLSLQSPGYLIFSFDDMEGYSKDYFYKIIHCDANWNPSENITPLDYIDGYQENRFYQSQNSYNTRMPYTHYEINLPNEDVKWKISGNYLLKIYQNNDENDLVVTRRFMVVDSKMKVVARSRRSAVPPYALSHQEFFFSVQHAGIQIGNPADQIQVAILQNGRWDNCVTKLEPTYTKNEEIGFDMQGKILFPGYKEFRPLDLRSFRFRTLQVERIETYANGYDIWLFEDVHRTYTSHIFTHDLNGKFFIQSHDNREGKIDGEYGHVNFFLKAESAYNGDVYVMGGFNDFQPQPSYKMTYNAEKGGYDLRTLLKTGFYDYVYGFVEEGTKTVDFQKIEGSSFESENDYLFLVYYKEFGGLYDQLVVLQKLNTRPD